MSQTRPYRGNDPTKGISEATRARLHKRLDELLDLQDQISGCVAESEVCDELADRLQYHAEQLVIRASHFAGEVAGGDARAIAFRHPDPTSRLALSRFLNVVAEFAAPYAYATLNLGIDTFTWTDVMAILDDLRSLEHGDLPVRLKPAAKRQPRGTRWPRLKEQWRAVQWVTYLTGQTTKEAAVKEVATAYDVSDKSIYNWHHDTEQVVSGHRRNWDLDDARKAGEHGDRPNFTLSPYRFENDQVYRDWLKHDGTHYKTLVNTMT